MKIYSVYHCYTYVDDYFNECYAEDWTGKLFESEKDAEDFVKRYSKPYKDYDGCEHGRLKIREEDIIPAGGSYSVNEEDFWWLRFPYVPIFDAASYEEKEETKNEAV